MGHRSAVAMVWQWGTTQARRLHHGRPSSGRIFSVPYTIMSSPFEGAPSLLLRHGELEPRCRVRRPPTMNWMPNSRSSARRGNTTRTISARAEPTTTCCMRRRGSHAFFRAYYFSKSADNKGEQSPSPEGARRRRDGADSELLRDGEGTKGMAATAASFMPPADYIAKCKWLTEAEVDVYATEYGRTGFTSARCRAIAYGVAFPIPEALPRCRSVLGPRH